MPGGASPGAGAAGNTPRRMQAIPAVRQTGSGSPPPPASLVNLRVNDIRYRCNGGEAGLDNLIAGDTVVFVSEVENIGSAATPTGHNGIPGGAGNLDVTWIDVSGGGGGNTLAWTDTDGVPLGALAIRDKAATGGPSGTLAEGTGQWRPTAGTYSIKAVVNSQHRIAETDESDNSVTSVIVVAPGVGGGGGGPGVNDQRTVLWTGVVGMDNLLANVGGLSLSDFAGKLSGLAISMGGPATSFASFVASEFASVRSILGSVSCGFNLAGSSSPIPTDAAGRQAKVDAWRALRIFANNAGVTCANCDGEPYGYDADNQVTNPWCSNGPLGLTSQQAFDYGAAIGGEIAQLGNGEIIIYGSSGASWVGGNNDQILAQNGKPNFYVPNKFTDFVKGLQSVGVDVALCDASFHRQGTQNVNAHGNYTTALNLMMDLVDPPFPNTKACSMIWPDIVEGSGAGVFWTPAEVASAVTLMRQIETGPAVLYEHGITSGLYNGYPSNAPEFGKYPDHAYWHSVIASMPAA